MSAFRLRYRTAFTIFFIAVCARTACATATFDAVKRDFQPSDTVVLDRQGEVLQRMRTDATVRRGQWVALGDVSPALRSALLLSEDKRFYEHSGVDWQAVSAAAWANLWNTRTRGASTITMQLAGLLDGEGRPAGGRSVVGKIGQTIDAQVLERSWRKDEILEAYLNLVPFRGELVGIDALSRTLFGKAPHGLDTREAAVAAALVRAPNARVAQVAQRACGVLAQMQQSQQARPEIAARPARKNDPQQAAAVVAKPSAPDCEGLDMFATAAVQRRAYDASEGFAPHLARHMLRSAAANQGATASATPATKPAATLQSTLRAPLQRFAVQTLNQHLRELQGRHVEDGAVLVLDNATGEVLAWVGSSGALSQAGEVDAVLAQRQPGSTLKPFLYAQAIAEQRLTAASLLEDSPAHIPTASGLYIPQNYDRSFKGWVSVRTALGASLNVPAVRTLVMVSPDAFFRQLRAVGLPLRESGDYFGYSLALGSSEVSLLGLTNSFRTLANGGRYSPVAPLELPAVRMVGQGPAKSRPALVPAPAWVQAVDARAAFIVGEIMSDTNARARTFGTDSVLGTRFWTAVKTGTSKDMRDNWAVGWSQRYTVGVWVGNAGGAPMWDVSGTSGAAPVWAAVMQHLHAREPSRAPVAPPGLVQAQATFGNGLEATRSEWFLQGTQQVVFAIDSVAVGVSTAGARGQKGLKNKPAATLQDGSAARITTPTSGTIIALDPDIPPAHQRLRLAAEGAGVRWRIDGKDFAKGNQAQWLPWPGRHSITLVDAKGQVLDEVRVEVRGAGVR